MIEVAWSPVPYVAGEIFQRTESPMWGSPTTFSPAWSSIMHTRSGAHTTVGRPVPYEYKTRPSGPTASTDPSPRQCSLTLTASCALWSSGTSFGCGSLGRVVLSGDEMEGSANRRIADLGGTASGFCNVLT